MGLHEIRSRVLLTALSQRNPDKIPVNMQVPVQAQPGSPLCKETVLPECGQTIGAAHPLRQSPVTAITVPRQNLCRQERSSRLAELRATDE